MSSFFFDYFHLFETIFSPQIDLHIDRVGKNPIFIYGDVNMRTRIIILGLIFFLICCSEQRYNEPETNEQAEILPLNDIAFKILDQKATEPILRRAGRQHSYTNYRYVIIGDVRPKMRNSEINAVNPIFISLLDSIALLIPKPDFVMVLGDLVCWGKKNEYQDYYDLVSNWMESTDIAVFAVPGNHEFYMSDSFESYEKFIGDLDYCFDWKDSTFIILNNVQSLDDNRSKIEDYQLEFLSIVLKTARSLKFVCSHVPYDGSMGIFQGYVELLDILAEYNITISWEAHVHHFKCYWHEGILHIVTGGGGAELHKEGGEYPPLSFNTKYHFLVVNVKRDRIEIKVFFYQEGFSSEDYNIILDIE